MAESHDVIEHRVVARMVLDDPAHRRDFVGVENRAEVGLFSLENRGQAVGMPMYSWLRITHGSTSLPAPSACSAAMAGLARRMYCSKSQMFSYLLLSIPKSSTESNLN